MTKLEKQALFVALMYIGIMGIGMSVMHFGFKFSYDSPEMAKVLFFFEVIMTVFAFYAYKKLTLGKMFQKFQFTFWLVPIVLVVLGAFIVAVTQSDFSKNQFLILTVVVTTLLVGVSEELIFRGIVLPSFLEKRIVLIAVLISATAFSSLHAVNILGGLTFSDMLTQLCMTFFAGLFYALMALKIKNIIPLMILHWFWDMILIGTAVTGVKTVSSIMLVGTLLEILFIIPLAISVYKEYTVK